MRLGGRYREGSINHERIVNLVDAMGGARRPEIVAVVRLHPEVVRRHLTAAKRAGTLTCTGRGRNAVWRTA